MAFTLHDPVIGPDHFAQKATGIESNQTVEMPADWRIRYLMCSIVAEGATAGTVEVHYSLYGTPNYYNSGQVVDLADPQPVVFDDCIDKVKFVPVGVDGDWTASVSQAKA